MTKKILLYILFIFLCMSFCVNVKAEDNELLMCKYNYSKEHKIFTALELSFTTVWDSEIIEIYYYPNDKLFKVSANGSYWDTSLAWNSAEHNNSFESKKGKLEEVFYEDYEVLDYNRLDDGIVYTQEGIVGNLSKGECPKYAYFGSDTVCIANDTTFCKDVQDSFAVTDSYDMNTRNNLIYNIPKSIFNYHPNIALNDLKKALSFQLEIDKERINNLKSNLVTYQLGLSNNDLTDEKINDLKNVLNYCSSASQSNHVYTFFNFNNKDIQINTKFIEVYPTIVFNKNVKNYYADLVNAKSYFKSVYNDFEKITGENYAEYTFDNGLSYHEIKSSFKEVCEKAEEFGIDNNYITTDDAETSQNAREESEITNELAQKDFLASLKVETPSVLQEIGCAVLFKDANGQYNNTWKILNSTLKFMQYGAIMLAAVLSIMDFIKVVPTNDKDAIKKTAIKSTTRLGIAIIIFFVPIIIDFILSIVGFTDATCNLI